MMRGVGGPLLCVGDLLADVGDANLDKPPPSSSPTAPLTSSLHSNACHAADPSLLPNLFQENYDLLNEALDGTEPSDHSWAVLTLKLCSALESADSLVQSANANAETLKEKIDTLEHIIKRRDTAVDEAKAVLSIQNN